MIFVDILLMMAGDSSDGWVMLFDIPLTMFGDSSAGGLMFVDK